MESATTRPFAVVTGASSGIGFEIARVLGSEGYDLLITAEDSELDGARRELEGLTSVEAIQVDLSRSGSVEELHHRVHARGRLVDALVLNAGIGAGGAFAGGTELEDEMQLIDLNVRSTVHLCKLEVEPMVQRNEGRILFSSSVSSTMPGAYQAVYNASMSFVQSFALALRNELKSTNVSVTSLMPEPTDTELHGQDDVEETTAGPDEINNPALVARQGVDAMLNGGGPRQKEEDQ